MVRGLLVFASWYVNGEWTLLEFCISNANDLTGTQLVPIHSEIVHADLMVMFLSLFGLVGHIFKERIDPTVGVFLYEAIHDNRQPIVKMAPAVFKTVAPTRTRNIVLELLQSQTCNVKYLQENIPDPLAPSLTGRSADRSTNERAAMAQKGNLTNFEISTGAELQARYGYVVVNGKYLVATEDLLTIAMIKAIQTRFINVYAYEVDGYTVQRTARLVYPNTFSWNDLFHLTLTS
ncbi:hypothetical protein GQ600_4122 [Phytophthora cactorum]|nr:hypothetical protein GQ600_4122 [Phytophthora cactorum]